MARFYTIYPSFTYSIYTSSPTEQHSPKRSRRRRALYVLYDDNAGTRGVIATERTYYSNTKATDHCFVIFLPSSGGERKTTPIHWNDDGDGVRYGSLIIIEAIRPGGPVRPFFWKSQHKIDVDEAIVVNSLNVTRNGASKKYVLYIGCKIFRTL